MSWQVLVFLSVLGVLSVWALIEMIVAAYYAPSDAALERRLCEENAEIAAQIRAENEFAEVWDRQMASMGRVMRGVVPPADEEPFRYSSSGAPLVVRKTVSGTFGGSGPDVSNIPKTSPEVGPVGTFTIVEPVSQTTSTLIDMLRQRDAMGRKKYGVTLDRKDLTFNEWAQHMTEELLDAAGYAQAAMRANSDAAPPAASENAAMLDWLISHRGVSVQYWNGDLERGWFVFFSDGISLQRTITHSHPTSRAAIKAAMEIMP